MALADTAKLIVEMGFRDKITGGLNRVDRSLAGMDRTLSSVNTRVSRTGIAIGSALGIGLERVVTSGVASLIGGVRSGVEEMQRLEDANLQTAAAIASTGGVAGQTVDEIRAMAESYEALNATIDDKAIQEAANVLLTFRRVGERAFEPALEAALNLSTALGQDLQTSVLQIGKALEDPIRGVTALRRAGVQLTEQQEDEIKTLVEQNRLYDAQQIILRELNVQVGGRFEAQGQGDAARAAALRDRIEDLQRIFATGLAPGLTRVREALIGAFENPQVIAGVKTVGDSIANFLSAENLETAGGVVREVFGYLAAVPWGAIGDGLRIVGAGAKTALDLFNSLPKDVQGILVAGFAANRLSGGALTSLAGLALSSLRTITAGHVTVIGPVTGGPGVPGGGGGLLGGLKTGVALASPLLAAAAAVEVVNFENMRNEQKTGLQGILDELPRSRGRIDASIAAIESEINMERPLLDGILFNTNVRPQLDTALTELRNVKAAQERSVIAARDAIPWSIRNATATERADGRAEARAAVQAGRLASIERIGASQIGILNSQLGAANSKLAAIQAKDFSPTIKVENKISSTVITNNIAQGRAVAGTRPTAI